MGTTAEELRGELAAERANLGADLDAIGDRMSPGRIVQRRRAAVRQRMGDVRDRIMGTADDVRESLTAPVSDAASSVSDSMRDAPEAMRRTTTGNPLAVGLVAFGAGLVIATLLPETDTEQHLVENVQPKLEELASTAGEAAHDVAAAVKPTVQQAAHDVQQSAQEAVGHVKEQATHAASKTADEAKAPVTDVRNL
jgi:gas vesicle protein